MFALSTVGSGAACIHYTIAAVLSLQNHFFDVGLVFSLLSQSLGENEIM